jgi:hypothetical protein
LARAWDRRILILGVAELLMAAHNMAVLSRPRDDDLESVRRYVDGTKEIVQPEVAWIHEDDLVSLGRPKEFPALSAQLDTWINEGRQGKLLEVCFSQIRRLLIEV